MTGRFRHGRRFPALGPVLFASLLIVRTTPAAAAPIEAGGRPERLRLDAIVTPEERIVCTGRRFLEAGSDSLILSGRHLVPERDYTFDATQGCFFLNLEMLGDSLSFPAGLVAFYRALPVELLPMYSHRDLLGSPPRPAPKPGAARDTTDRSFPVRPATDVPGEAGSRPELDLSGSKTFTFELGSNRDLTLRQTLDLRVNGRLTDDVKLRAILSDRNLPFQPEGNTAELEELDRILIEVESPGARVGLGDQDLNVTSGTLGRFSRRLQGLAAEVGPPGRHGQVVAASQRGEFKTFEFLGVDGKQGPYPLSDRAGGRGVVIVAGSEHVWLDGVEMTRGLDRDYTIDYGRAELTFSPRRAITADSRIAVDYEFSAVGYRRSLYLLAGRAGEPEAPITVNLEVARESDDETRPLSGDLSEAEKARLAQAGDSLITSGSGIRLVGDGLGRYLLAFDDLNSRSYFRFVGLGQGNYEVTFVKVGAGLADYGDSLAGADTVYVYRGPNEGQFAPAGGLTQPVQLATAHLAARAKLGDRGQVLGEFALSGRDLNTLSALDDDDNDGSAGILDVQWKALDNLEFTGHVRNLGRNFATLGRIDDAFSYDREWNLPVRDRPLAESRRGAGGTYRPFGGLSFGTEFGALSGSGRTSDRRLVNFSRSGSIFASGSLLRVTSALDSTRHAGTLDRETAGAGATIGWFKPVARYEHEERATPENGAGTRYRLGAGDLNFGSFGPLAFSLGVEGRDNDARGSGDVFRTVSRAVTRRGSFSWSGGGTLSMSGALSARDVSRPESGTSRTDLATLDVSQRSRNNAFVTDFHCQVATTGVETRSRTLRFVGPGMGNYDQFGNLFPGGGYELDEGPLGAEELTTDLDVSLHVELTPYRAAGSDSTPGPGWVGRNLGWDGTFRVEEQSRLPLGRPGTLFDFSSYQRPESTLRGRIQVHQTLEIFPRGRIVLKVRQDLDDVANYQFTNFREDRTEHLGGVALRSTALSRLTLELEQRLGTRQQAVTFGTSADRRKADVYETHATANYRPTTAVRVAVETTWRSEQTSASTGARSIDVNPRFSWLPTAKGRLDLTARWITASRRGGYTGIGGFSSLFLQDRVDVSLNGDYRVTTSITVGAGITGRKFEGSDTVVDGRTEVRAYF